MEVLCEEEKPLKCREWPQKTLTSDKLLNTIPHSRNSLRDWAMGPSLHNVHIIASYEEMNPNARKIT